MHKIVPNNAVLIPEIAKLKFHGVIYDVYHWQQAQFGGSKVIFEMLRRPDTVKVIGIVDDKILVINDNQPHSGERLSFPGGRVDKSDLSIESAAQREMLEETGYSFKHWRLIKVWQPHTKLEWFIYLFIAWEVDQEIKPQLDEGEKITVEHLTFKQVKDLVFKRDGYLGEAQSVFDNIASIKDLLALPAFEGKTIER